MDPYAHWRIHEYEFADADEKVSPFQKAVVAAGWLRRAREALCLSANQMAIDMGVDSSYYHRLEKREDSGKISVAQLSRAAAAMNCELVYAIRPKQRVPFSWLIWNTLIGLETDYRGWIPGLMVRLRKRRKDPRFRAANGWTRIRG
jgi:transcriptional regulator with XRE-family HTH domain